jgi:hypothetical protein
MKTLVKTLLIFGLEKRDWADREALEKETKVLRSHLLVRNARCVSNQKEQPTITSLSAIRPIAHILVKFAANLMLGFQSKWWFFSQNFVIFSFFLNLQFE